MSSLQRYKKSGGFFQLLSLIETFGPQKKEKFLEMIEAESRVWAMALREKMLTIERIFSWPDQVVIEVFKALPVKNMAVVLEGIKPEHRAKIDPFLSASDKRRMSDSLADAKPKPEEIASTMVKMVEITRKMLSQRELHAEKFDEKLVIPEDYEVMLEQRGLSAIADSVGGTASGAHDGDHQEAPDMSALAAAASGNPVHTSNVEVSNLQRTLAVMLKENKTLKDEVRVLRDKLEQIKRIA